MLVNPTDVASETQREKDLDIRSKGTNTNNKTQALPIEEGEILPTSTPQENTERKECVDRSSNTNLNTNG